MVKHLRLPRRREGSAGRVDTALLLGQLAPPYGRLLPVARVWALATVLSGLRCAHVITDRCLASPITRVVVSLVAANERHVARPTRCRRSRRRADSEEAAGRHHAQQEAAEPALDQTRTAVTV